MYKRRRKRQYRILKGHIIINSKFLKPLFSHDDVIAVLSKFMPQLLIMRESGKVHFIIQQQADGDNEWYCYFLTRWPSTVEDIALLYVNHVDQYGLICGVSNERDTSNYKEKLAYDIASNDWDRLLCLNWNTVSVGLRNLFDVMMTNAIIHWNERKIKHICVTENSYWLPNHAELLRDGVEINMEEVVPLSSMKEVFH